MATRKLTGKPTGKPRGRSFQPGKSANPGGKPKNELAIRGEIAAEHRRRIEKDARLLAREHSVEAVMGLVTIMRGVVKVTTHDKKTGKAVEIEVIAPPAAMLTAATAILDRGYGRPPQALEIYGGDVTPEEREGSALAIITSKLIELERRERAAIPSQLN